MRFVNSLPSRQRTSCVAYCNRIGYLMSQNFIKEIGLFCGLFIDVKHSQILLINTSKFFQQKLFCMFWVDRLVRSVRFTLNRTQTVNLVCLFVCLPPTTTRLDEKVKLVSWRWIRRRWHNTTRVFTLESTTFHTRQMFYIGLDDEN